MGHEAPREIGIVGLGRMGGGLALQALERGLRVAGYDRRAPAGEVAASAVEVLDAPGAFRERLRAPRIVFLYVPAGRTVDAVLDDLVPALEPGDVVVDGGNSYWRDSLARWRRLEEGPGIRFVDCGTSGGVRGARHGACFMAGGTADSFAAIEPVLRALAVEGGCVWCGGPGAGHFVKLVHNGIGAGMVQAIGEGLHLLERFGEELPVGEILRAWTHGSVIRSWPVELLAEEYRVRGGTAAIDPHIEDTGEVDWLIEDALAMEVPIHVIAASAMQLAASRDRDRIASRAVAMMRHGFGEHAFGPDESVRRHRRTSRADRDPDR